MRVPNVVQTGKQSPFFIAGFIPTVLYLSFIGLPLVGLVLKAITSEGLIDALTGSLVIDAMLVTLVSSLTTVVIIFIVGICNVIQIFIINCSCTVSREKDCRYNH